MKFRPERSEWSSSADEGHVVALRLRSDDEPALTPLCAKDNL